MGSVRCQPPVEMPEGQIGHVIWQEFEPVGPKEGQYPYDYELDHLFIRSLPFLIVKTSRGMACVWVSVVVNSSLIEGVVLVPLKETWSALSSKSPSWT